MGNYLIGRAWYWFEPIMRERNSKPKEDRSDRTSKVLSSYNEMRKAMRQVFGDVDERTVAAQKLQHLRQTRSVRDYITDFQMITSNLEWDEDALMDKFKGGLKQHILNLLIYFPVRPKDLDELFERAQRIDTEYTNQRKREYFNSGTYNRKNNTSYHPKRDRDGDVQMTGAKVDLEKARRDKLCFNCGKQGHQARLCKTKKKDQSPRIRMVRAFDNIADESRKTILDFEPIPGDSDTDSFNSSLMREVLRREAINEEKIHRRRTNRELNDRDQEQPAVMATSFQEIEVEEESDKSDQTDEFDDDDLQCDQRNRLAETICAWKEKVDQHITKEDRIIPELRSYGE